MASVAVSHRIISFGDNLVDTGPGEAFKIHAWTCDEELDACWLTVLIPAVGMDTNSYPEVEDTDVSGAVNAFFQKPGDGRGDNASTGGSM